MKKIVMWLMSTLTVLVLLFGYHTSTSSTAAAAGGNTSASTPYSGSTTVSGSGTTGTTGTPSASGSTSSSSSSSAAGSSSAASPSSAAKSGTVTGTVAQTRWGPVQVQLTVANGSVTNVSVVQYPDGNGRDQEINARALPILIQETLKAQSAKIDMVSGATYTSDGYVTSLQSALDQAGL
jgi:uncharacterized protein with FMN-binding domain